MIKCKESNYKQLRHRALHKCVDRSKHNTFHKLMTTAQCTANHPDRELQAGIDHPDAEMCGIVYDPMDQKKPTLNKWIDWLEDNWGTKDDSESDNESSSDSDSDSDLESSDDDFDDNDEDEHVGDGEDVEDDGDDTSSQKEEPSDITTNNHSHPQP